MAATITGTIPCEELAHRAERAIAQAATKPPKRVVQHPFSATLGDLLRAQGIRGISLDRRPLRDPKAVR